jgi:hypothetical protein
LRNPYEWAQHVVTVDNQSFSGLNQLRLIFIWGKVLVTFNLQSFLSWQPVVLHSTVGLAVTSTLQKLGTSGTMMMMAVSPEK